MCLMGLLLLVCKLAAVPPWDCQAGRACAATLCLLRNLAFECATCATTGSTNCAVALEAAVLCMEPVAVEWQLSSIVLALQIGAVDQAGVTVTLVHGYTVLGQDWNCTSLC